MSAPTFIDLFSGCGGLSRGFTDAGLCLELGIDSDRAAAATFAANFGEGRTMWAGIESLRSVPKVDVIVGGPPCQGFSGLGKQDPGDLRNKLWREYARVVQASECSVFVLENVDRFSRSPEMESLERSTRKGGLLHGYELRRHLLNAADYGTPQRRTRTVIIGSRIGDVGPIEATHSKGGEGGLKIWRTVGDAIAHQALDPDPLWPVTQVPAWDGTIGGAFKLSDIHVGRNYSHLSLQRFRRIPVGGNRFDLPDELKAPCWIRHTSGAGDVMGRLVWERPSVTIRTEFFKPEKGRYLHPTAHRALTHAEAALLQGFDSRHLWCGNRQEVARQIGNAVPPPLAYAIAVSVRAALMANKRSRSRRR